MPDFKTREARNIFEQTEDRLSHAEMASAVDRLYEVRRQIKELEAEAAGIRQQILTGEISAYGDEYLAKIVRQITLLKRSQVR